MHVAAAHNNGRASPHLWMIAAEHHARGLSGGLEHRQCLGVAAHGDEALGNGVERETCVMVVDAKECCTALQDLKAGRGTLSVVV